MTALDAAYVIRAPDTACSWRHPKNDDLSSGQIRSRSDDGGTHLVLNDVQIDFFRPLLFIQPVQLLNGNLGPITTTTLNENVVRGHRRIQHLRLLKSRHDRRAEAFKSLSFRVFITYALEFTMVSVLDTMSFTAQETVTDREDLAAMGNSAHTRDTSVDSATGNGFFRPCQSSNGWQRLFNP